MGSVPETMALSLCKRSCNWDVLIFIPAGLSNNIVMSVHYLHSPKLSCSRRISGYTCFINFFYCGSRRTILRCPWPGVFYRINSCGWSSHLLVSKGSNIFVTNFHGRSLNFVVNTRSSSLHHFDWLCSATLPSVCSLLKIYEGL